MKRLDDLWPPPPGNLVLPRDEVHVWRADLDRKTSEISKLQQTLSEDERARAARFHFSHDRSRFIVARGVLRAILGRYVNVPPGQIEFRYEYNGKPGLAAACEEDELRFNLSHSHGLALYAVASGREVGIDIEYIHATKADDGIAERFFSPAEVAALRALPAKKRTRAFFTCWTRKEAYIKARGTGLALPLDQFDVTVDPGQPAALLSTRGDPEEASRWSLRDLDPGPGCVAALAVEGGSWQLRCWSWPTAE